VSPSNSKSLQDQIREIQKLLEDADESLAQAKWALETLIFRIGREDLAARAEEDEQ
jgi:hypothetical protein